MEKLEGKLHIRNTAKIPDYHAKDHVADKLEGFMADEKKLSVPIESLYGPESRERSLKVFEIVKEELRARGIENPILAPVFYKKDLAAEMRSTGRATAREISIFNLTIENMELKQLSMFKTLVHELYHSVARETFLVLNAKHDDGYVQTVSTQITQGASFTPVYGKRNEHGYLLEEGAAVQFEERAFSQVKKLFSEETQLLHDDAIAGFAKDMNKTADQNAEEYPLYAFLIDTTSPKAKFLENPNYAASREVVKYLTSVIPDFLSILEQGRTQGKIFPLARAIDGAFGKGWYRKLSTAITEQARDMLPELKAAK